MAPILVSLRALALTFVRGMPQTTLPFRIDGLARPVRASILRAGSMASSGGGVASATRCSLQVALRRCAALLLKGALLQVWLVGSARSGRLAAALWQQ